MQYALYLNLIFSGYLYFALVVILGSGQNELIVSFQNYLITSSALVYAIMFKEIMLRGRVSVYLVGIFLFTGIVSLNVIASDYHDFSVKQYLLYLIYGPTGFYIGLKFSKINNGELVIKYIYPIIIIGVVSTLLSIKTMMGRSIIDLMDFYGGGQYQSYSYFAAICLIISVAILISSSDLSSFKRIMLFSSILILIIGVALSGGRGGGILIIVSLLYFMKYADIKNLIHSIKYVAVLIFLIYMIAGVYGINAELNFDRIADSFLRFTSFINSSGIDVEGISNRELFYSKTFEMIASSPFVGHGFFGSAKYYGEFYPHNIILEMILHFGIIIFIALFMLSINLLRKFLLITKQNPLFVIMIPITLFSIVMLMLSGSYLTEPSFWVVISYLISVSNSKNLPKKINDEKNNNSYI